MFHWTVHRKETPVTYPRSDAIAVGHKLYSFGGYVNRYGKSRNYMKVNIFNTVSLRWMALPLVTIGRGGRPLEVPSRRRGHTAVLIGDNTVYIWGGKWELGSLGYNDLFTFDVDTHRWFKPRVSGIVPSERSNHSACVLEKVMYVHGGVDNLTNGYINDNHKLDTTTMVWTLIMTTRLTQPPYSSFHSATIIGTNMFVFGGHAGRECYNNIRVFDTETNCWLSTPSAQLLTERCCSHSAVAYNGELYIYGGWNCEECEQTFNHLWKFNPDTFSWKKLEHKGKCPPQMYFMCCCIVGDRIVFFGGHTHDTNVHDNLYILDLRPSLRTLCKLAVIQYNLPQSDLPRHIRWELETMTTPA